MSKLVEAKSNSNLTAITGLKVLLDDLCTQWRLNDDNAIPPDSPKTGVDMTDLHPFGMVNIDHVRQEFLKLTTAVRANCSQFESEVIGDVTKIGAGAEPAFRKHLMHLKEQANFESTVVRVKSTLQQTIRKLNEALANDSSTFATIKVKALQELAEDLGLACYLDTSEKPGFDSPVTTITTAGNIIVVDIDVDERGTVLKAKLTYATDTHQDDKVDKILLENLKSDDLSDFLTNLSTLSFFDKMNTKYAPIDFFVINKNLMEDLRTIYNQEILMASNDPAHVLNNGHGIPQMHLVHPGVSIYFWAGPTDLLETEWGQLQASIENAELPSTLKEASRMWITFADSTNLITYPPTAKSHYLLSFDETQESIQAEENGEHFMILDEPQFHDSGATFRYLKPSPSHPEAVTLPVCFVAKFDKPIPVSEYICSRLANLIGLSGSNALLSDRDYLHNSQDDISLETLLIKDCTESNDNEQLTNANKLLDSNTRWNVTVDNMNQTYVYMNSSSNRGRLIRRIPFEHPVQLFGIMQTLRKQIVFNHLFRSVFNSDSMPKDSQESSLKSEVSLADLLQDDGDDQNTMHLEVAVLQAPTTIQVTLMAPKSNSEVFLLVSFTINIPDMTPTAPTVTMQKPSSLEADGENQLAWNNEIFDQQKMSSIIQKTYSIPLLARWLWNRMRTSTAPYVMPGSRKKAFARSNSYFDKTEDSNKRLRSNTGTSVSSPGKQAMEID